MVCVNRFKNDTEEEIAAVVEESIRAGALKAVASDHFRQGGAGARDLGVHVIPSFFSQPDQFIRWTRVCRISFFVPPADGTPACMSVSFTFFRIFARLVVNSGSGSGCVQRAVRL